MQDTVHKFQKNAREEVRFTLVEYKGIDCLDIRCYITPVTPTDQGEVTPTRKGLTLRVEHLDELERGIKRLKAALTEVQPVKGNGIGNAE
ncbi:PC4/YdbC family ssDNA-binding protein [Candidatus Eisenbacteria bacterium]|uniref:PC4/YdbC family ssDNA-binding protein n=1 Tax=Eiseniibacteriota bacterium TaxID=2212470 RepID=A0ABV6YMV2_UNCEI